MDIGKLKKVVELASLGVCEKEELLSTIDITYKELERIETERQKVKDRLDTVKKQNELAGEDQVRLREIADDYGLEYEMETHCAELESVGKEYEEAIEKLQQALNNCSSFNKYRCFDNIRFLLKEKNDVKIGQIEKEAGVSLGYMSRMEKPENTSEPSVEFIVTAARMLNVSIDVLLFIDMAAMNPTEKYLAKLMQKLNKDTIEDKLEWHRHSADSLNRMETDMNGYVEHPLFDVESFYEQGETEYPTLVERVVFTSHTFDCHTTIHDDCFSLNMKGKSILYLMDISKSVYRTNDSNAFAKEIWIFTPGVGAQFLTSNRDISQLAELVEILFDTVKKGAKHPKIKKDIKSVLDAFLIDDDLGEDDEDILYFNKEGC